MHYMRMQGRRETHTCQIDLNVRGGPTVSAFKGSSIPFSWFTGDANWLDHGGTWISRRFHNGDWSYWILVEILGEKYAGQYSVSVSVVAPAALNLNDLRAQWNDSDYYGKSWQECEDDKEHRLFFLDGAYRYGLRATLVHMQGTNAHELIRQAKREATAITGLFGFYMDRPLNRIGDTGWDFVSGNVASHVARGRRDVRERAELGIALALAGAFDDVADGWLDDEIDGIITRTVDEWFTTPFDQKKRKR